MKSEKIITTTIIALQCPYCKKLQTEGSYLHCTSCEKLVGYSGWSIVTITTEEEPPEVIERGGVIPASAHSCIRAFLNLNPKPLAENKKITPQNIPTEDNITCTIAFLSLCCPTCCSPLSNSAASGDFCTQCGKPITEESILLQFSILTGARIKGNQLIGKEGSVFEAATSWAYEIATEFRLLEYLAGLQRGKHGKGKILQVNTTPEEGFS